MTDKPITPLRTDDFEESRGDAIALGDLLIVTPQVKVLCRDAPGFSTLLVDHPDLEERRVAFLLYVPPADTGNPEIGAGLIAQMDATVARTIAASLLRLANRIDTKGMH